MFFLFAVSIYSLVVLSIDVKVPVELNEAIFFLYRLKVVVVWELFIMKLGLGAENFLFIFE